MYFERGGGNMKQISFENIDFGGFWESKQNTNRDVTMPVIYKQFYETGRVTAFACDWKPGDEKKPHIFWDSDIAKWIEGVAYSLINAPDENLEEVIDIIVDWIHDNQFLDGYFNIYHTVCDPTRRFTNRDAHELYCAGHLIEAAIAYHKATGKSKFLRCMEKYVLHIKDVFMDKYEAAFATPGHEEIELALIKLWEYTEKLEYLKLARYFVNLRGNNEKDRPIYNHTDFTYEQSHEPVREMREAVGHSVRAEYLYCAMADLARIDNDEELKTACKAIFNDIATKKMYITGGVGSGILGECFTEEYDLPNQFAYSESCAGIGLALLARRMNLLDVNSIYDDVAERVIYNNVFASCSISGREFFYTNPLEINLKERRLTHKYRMENQNYPATERQPVFDCSCCPPNFTRFIESFGDFLYTTDDNTIFIHHYAKSTAVFDGIKIKQTTDYPLNGKIKITVSGKCTGKEIALRIPSWCQKFTVKADGTQVKQKPQNGFIYIKCENKKLVIELDLEMKAVLNEANPLIDQNFGRVAVSYGPFIYCLEDIDTDYRISEISLSKNLNATIKYVEFFKANIMEVDAFIVENFEGLYRPLDNKKTPIRLMLVPYYTFANRGESDMAVWLKLSR